MSSDAPGRTNARKVVMAFALSRDFSYLLLALAVVSLGFGILTPIIPKFATTDLNMDPSEIGAVYSLFAVAYVIVMLPAGYLCDRMGRKPLIVAGTLMFGITTFALVLITNSFQFALLRTLEGVGAALVIPAAFALTIDIVPENKRGMAMGAEGTAQLLGGLGGPGLGGILAGHIGFYYPFYTAAGLSVLCAVLVALIREPRDRTANKDDRSPLSMFGAWRRNVKQNRTLVALTGRGFVMGVVQGLWNLGLVLFWYEELGMSEVEVGAAMSIGMLAMLLGTLPFGALCDRVGRRPFLLIGGTVMTVGLATNVWASEAWHVFVIVALTDLGASMSNPAVGATLADVMSRNERGRVMGAYQMIQGVGNIVGYSALTIVYDAVSPEAPILLCAVALGVATLIIYLFVHETRTKEAASETSSAAR